MVVAFSLIAILVAFVIISRGHDVRLVLLLAALAIGLGGGDATTVFRTTTETLAEKKFVLPICSAMGFAHVVKEKGCVDALLEIMLRPLAGRGERLFVPGGSTVAFVVNAAIPSQTSTLAALGPLVVAPMAASRERGRCGSCAGLRRIDRRRAPQSGVADIAAAATVTGTSAPRVVVPLAPAVLAAFAAGLIAFLVGRRMGIGRNDTPRCRAAAG